MNPSSHSRRWRVVGALAVVGVLVLASCSDKSSDSSSDTTTKSGDAATSTIRISGQDFPEQRTLVQVYGQYLQAQGFKVDIQDPVGTRKQLFAALKSGKLDLQIDYSGSAVVELGGEASGDADATYKTLTGLLKPKGLEASEQSSAADANALVALTSWAKDNDVKTISDLSKVQDPLTLGGAAECAKRPECLPGYQKTYGLTLTFKVVDYGPPLVAALKANEIQVAQYGSTAPEIAAGTIVELQDDKHLQDAQNVVPIFTTKISSDKLTKALNTLSAKITTDDLAAWNQSTDVDKEDPADVATAWLKDNNLD